MKIKKCIRVSLTCLVFLYISGNSVFVGAADLEKAFPYSIKINLITYTGSYLGETQNGIPNGKGCFETDEDSPEQFIYDGEFESGIFSGEGIVTWNETTKFESEFEDGVPTGNGIITYEDGSYEKIRHSEGVPVGGITLFTEDGEYQEQDFFYEGERIQDLLNIASIPEYEELFVDENGYYGDVFKITGTIENISETEKKCILKIRDREGDLYWSEYSNVSYQLHNQAIMPDMKQGDECTLFGFFKGINTYSGDETDEDSGYMFPEIVAITAIGNEERTIDFKADSFEYERVCKSPYTYYNKRNTIKGNVDKIVYRNDESWYLRFISENGNIYYVLVDSKKVSYIPTPGDFITVSGFYKGLYKEYDKEKKICTGKYPYISASKIR